MSAWICLVYIHQLVVCWDSWSSVCFVYKEILETSSESWFKICN